MEEYTPIFISYSENPPPTYKEIVYNKEVELSIPEKQLDAIDYSIIFDNTSLLKNCSKKIVYTFANYYEFSSDVSGTIFKGVITILGGVPTQTVCCWKADLDKNAVYAKYPGSPLSNGKVPIYWDSNHIYPIRLYNPGGDLVYPFSSGDGATTTYEAALAIVQPRRDEADAIGHTFTMNMNIPEPVLYEESIINKVGKNGYMFIQTGKNKKEIGNKFKLIISGNKFIEKESEYLITPSYNFPQYTEWTMIHTYYDYIYTFYHPEYPFWFWHFEYGHTEPPYNFKIIKNKQMAGYIEKSGQENKIIKNKFMIAVSNKSNNKEEKKYEK